LIEDQTTSSFFKESQSSKHKLNPLSQMSQMQATGASKRLLISVSENQSSFASLLEKDGSANGVVMKLNNTGKDVRRRVFLSNDSKYLQWEPSKKKDGFG